MKLLSKFQSFGMIFSLNTLGFCASGPDIKTYISDPTPSVNGFVGSDLHGNKYDIEWGEPKSEGLICHDQVDYRTLLEFCRQRRTCDQQGKSSSTDRESSLEVQP